MRFAFGELVIDTHRLLIERDGVNVPVQPQVFDVMAHLLVHRDRVVTKEEILDEVWGDRFVSESALTSRIKEARRLIGDDGRRNSRSRRSTGGATGGSPPSRNSMPRMPRATRGPRSRSTTRPG